MPRQARLDAPGVLQHVMERGIERRKIFCDDPSNLVWIFALCGVSCHGHSEEGHLFFFKTLIKTANVKGCSKCFHKCPKNP